MFLASPCCFLCNTILFSNKVSSSVLSPSLLSAAGGKRFFFPITDRLQADRINTKINGVIPGTVCTALTKSKIILIGTSLC